MSDNITAPATGEVFATDEIGGVHIPLTKIVLGADSVNDGTVDAANPLPITATVFRAEDAAHASGDTGIMALAVRGDAETALAADGDYTPLITNSAGRLKVSAGPQMYPLVTGNITANAQTVFADVDRASNVMIFMVATTLVGHNVTFEGSLNSTNGINGDWFVIQAVRSNANTIETTSGVLAATPAYAWEASVNGLTYVRVRATAHTSGTAAYQLLRGAYATEPIPAAQVTGTQPVSGTVTGVGPAAHDAAIANNPVRIAGRAVTANYAAVAGGDVADMITTLVGALITKPYASPEQGWSNSLALTSATAQPVQPALASNKRHITALQAINTGAAVVDLILLDGTTERWRLPLPVNVPVTIAFPTELITTVNTALNANLSAAGTVRINAQGYNAP